MDFKIVKYVSQFSFKIRGRGKRSERSSILTLKTLLENFSDFCHWKIKMNFCMSKFQVYLWFIAAHTRRAQRGQIHKFTQSVLTFDLFFHIINMKFIPTIYKFTMEWKFARNKIKNWNRSSCNLHLTCRLMMLSRFKFLVILMSSSRTP